MSLLDGFTNDSTVEDEKDSLGGFTVDSGIYNTLIEMAYIEKSKKGAMGFFLHLKDVDSGTVVRVQEYISGGDAKGNKNTYVDAKGKTQNLPGYNKMNSLVNIMLQKDINGLVHEEKVINRYDFDAKKEVPTKTQVLTELLNQPITVGIIKQTVDKNIQDASGAYVPSGDTRDENIADKFFRAADGLTSQEIRGKATEAAFKAKWAAQNTGKTRDRTAAKIGGAKAGAPAAAGGAAAADGSPSLFT